MITNIMRDFLGLTSVRVVLLMHVTVIAISLMFFGMEYATWEEADRIQSFASSMINLSCIIWWVIASRIKKVKK